MGVIGHSGLKKLHLKNDKVWWNLHYFVAFNSK